MDGARWKGSWMEGVERMVRLGIIRFSGKVAGSVFYFQLFLPFLL